MEHHRPHAGLALNDVTSHAPADNPYVRPRWSVILFAWSVPAFFAGTQATLAYTFRGQIAQQWPFVGLEPVRWLSWALVTPLIFRLFHRFPLRRPVSRLSIAVHFACALGIGLVLESFMFALSVVAQRYAEPAMARRIMFTAVYLSVVLGRTVGSMVTYGAVVGVAAALEYSRRVREGDLRALHLESQLATAQVRALKMQLHPHFLFNTLHAVNVLIGKDPLAATRMVTRLGDLLRVTLSRAASAEVPWSDELDLVALYFEIERTRFQDRLTIEYDVDPATPRALVPDLILQPLAENAVRHGVSETAGAAKILVRSRTDGRVLTLEVHDNGRGLIDPSARRDGVGLRSTRERLEKLYGAAQSVELIVPECGGCIARLRLPLRFAAVEA